MKKEKESTSKKKTKGKDKILLPISSAKSLSGLADTILAMEINITRAKIRQSHLNLGGYYDPQTTLVVEAGTEFKEKLVKMLKPLIEEHPASKWFLAISGVSYENSAKVVGLIDIERARHISSLWKFAGFHVDDKGKAPKRERGKTSEFNGQLRTMMYRLTSSLINAHELMKSKGKDGTAYGKYYENELNKYMIKYTNRGTPVLKSDEAKKKKMKEGEYMPILQVYNRARRKVSKLFLAHLWQVWREAEGLPVSLPYSHDKLEHEKMIDPWDMVDDKKLKKITTAQNKTSAKKALGN